MKYLCVSGIHLVGEDVGLDAGLWTQYGGGVVDDSSMETCCVDL